MAVLDCNEKNIRKHAEAALADLGGTSWGFLVKQFPVLFDDKLSVVDKLNLDEHDTFSFACPNCVGFSEERCLKQITEWADENKKTLDYWDVRNIVKNVLVHEFGHILLGHVFEPPKKNDLDNEANIVAHEIETNRGIDKTERAKYFDEVIISDDKEMFDSIKPLYTHEAIFNECKRILKAEREKNPEKEQPREKPQQKEQGNGKKQDEKTGDGSQGQSQDRENEPKQEQKKDSGMNDKMKNHIKTMEQAQANAGKGQTEQTPPGLLDRLGLAPSKDFEQSEDIDSKLRVITKLALNNEIKKALSRIKGELVGEVCKDKVGTYSRPSRKSSDDGLMLRGKKRGKNKKPKILVALDARGSMDCVAVNTAATAVQLISKTVGRNKSDVEICMFDTRVYNIEKLSNCTDIASKYAPCGGTSFSAVVQTAIKRGADVVIDIGDGYDALPSEQYLRDIGILTGDRKYPKWIDALITPYVDSVERVKQNEYTREDRQTGRRETYWLGNKADAIKSIVDTM